MYDRKLIDYLPTFEKNIKEFDVILTKAEDPEMLSAWNSANDLMNDQFIADATENGVSRMEKILKIIPKATETLDSRKFTLLTRMSEQPPFTITALERQLKTLCGEGNYEVTRNVADKILHVRIALVARSNFNDVALLLERIVPANMVIDLSLKYKQHEAITKYTHEELQKFTHEQLRNEVD